MPRRSLAWPAVIVPLIIAAGLCLAQAPSAKVQLPGSASATTNPVSIPTASDFTLQRTIPLSPSSSLTSLDPFNTVRGPDGYHSYFPLMLELAPAAQLNPILRTATAPNIFYEDHIFVPPNMSTLGWPIIRKLSVGTQVLTGINYRAANVDVSETYPSTTQPAGQR